MIARHIPILIWTTQASLCRLVGLEQFMVETWFYSNCLEFPLIFPSNSSIDSWQNPHLSCITEFVGEILMMVTWVRSSLFLVQYFKTSHGLEDPHAEKSERIFRAIAFIPTFIPTLGSQMGTRRWCPCGSLTVFACCPRNASPQRSSRAMWNLRFGDGDTNGGWIRWIGSRNRYSTLFN